MTFEEELDKRKKPSKVVEAQSRSPKVKKRRVLTAGVKGMEKRGCPRSGNADREWIRKVLLH